MTESRLVLAATIGYVSIITALLIYAIFKLSKGK